MFFFLNHLKQQNVFFNSGDQKSKIKVLLDFPDGPVNKNTHASAGDMSLIPCPGRFHMPQSN